MLNSSFGPRQNPCCNIQQRLHGQGPRIVLLACESMRSDQGGRKAVSNPFFSHWTFILSFSWNKLSMQMPLWKLKVLWHSQLAITFSPSILEPFGISNIHQLRVPFNFMMASDPAASSAAEAEPMINADVWLLIHADDPQDKQFSFL